MIGLKSKLTDIRSNQHSSTLKSAAWSTVPKSVQKEWEAKALQKKKDACLKEDALKYFYEEFISDLVQFGKVCCAND